MRLPLPRLAAALATVVLLARCGGSDDVTEVRVMTQNLAIGIELEPILLAPASAIPALVDAAWAQKDVSDFTVRAGAIAAAIDADRPDVVSLQEVSEFLEQVPGDGSPNMGIGTPATTVVVDFLQVLQDALAARGLSYAVAGSVTNADIELTAASGNDYRVIDREVLLVRSGLAVSNAQSGSYATALHLTIGGVVPFEYLRGWVAADVTVGGKTFSVYSTHLEAFDPRAQSGQAAELRAMVDTSKPAIVVGDMNSDPHDAAWPAYGMLVSPTVGLADSAAEVGVTDATCCRDALCEDPAATLDRRVDLVLHTPHFEARSATLHGTRVSDMVSSGGVGPLWPSDHAGVGVVLGLE